MRLRTALLLVFTAQLCLNSTCREEESIRQLRIPGDIIIGGVFPVHSKGAIKSGQPCGQISETRLEFI